MVLSLLATMPTTIEWTPMVGVVMVVCNVIAIAIGKFKIDQPSAGPALPMSNMFGGMGFPALLATTSFGHVLGIGAILGLANMGII